MRDVKEILNEFAKMGASFGWLGCVDLALGQGADVIEEVAELSATYDQLDILKLAVQYGADNYQGMASAAIFQNNPKIIEYLLDIAEDGDLDVDALAVLASAYDNLFILKLLQTFEQPNFNFI